MASNLDLAPDGHCPVESGDMELTVLMPCLNEAATVGDCISKAREFLQRTGIEGEVLLADNGSSDDSVEIALAYGARVVQVAERGYGSALRAGIAAANGRYVIFGDADDSYDFTALEPFVAALRTKHDLVMGNRFAGGIAPGAMPWLHRHVGNPLLSFIGRHLFHVPIHDFHCGLRGIDRERFLALKLNTSGMEFASEVVVRAQLQGYRITEVPTTLSPDGRGGRSHLRAWHDGWRHVVYLFLCCPRWLFLVPGIVLIAGGLAAGIPTSIGMVTIGHVHFDVDTMAAAAAAVIVGIQAVEFAVFSVVYGVQHGVFPGHTSPSRVLRILGLGRTAAVGLVLIGLGITGLAIAMLSWSKASFGVLHVRHQIRVMIPSLTAVIVGFQLLLGRLFLTLLGGELSVAS